MIVGLEEFADLLYGQVQQHLQPSVREKLFRGEPLAFGPVQVDLTGIRVRGEFLPRDRLVPVTVTGEDVVIRRLGRDEPWCTLPLAEVPNLALFLDVVRMLLADRGSP
jgi:hypothetical protein